MSKEQITIPIFIPHLGCPHKCVFCNQWETSGKHSLPDAKKIDSIVSRYLTSAGDMIKNREIAFFGGTFTGIEEEKQREYLSIANKFLSEKKINGIRLSTRPDFISRKKLDILKEYNVTTVELGAQSFDDEVLLASRRGHNSLSIIKAAELLREYGFNFIIQLMPGLPGDTAEKSLKSAEQAARLIPSGVRIYPVVVLKNTALSDLYYNKKYNPLSLEKAVELCKDLYLLFTKQNIPIIRVGLHPFSPDEIKNIISGPYHSSFGFFVKSRVKREILEKKLLEKLKNPETNSKKNLMINIPLKNKEEYIGNKKENIHYLMKKYGILNIDYTFDDLIEPVIKMVNEVM